MLATIVRLTTSSRDSRCVQRVIGRPDNLGDSHATAKIRATWSAVNLPGDPGRGASERTSRTASRSRRGSVHSQAQSASQASRHRCRQIPTCCRLSPTSTAICSFKSPSNPSTRIDARWTIPFASVRDRLSSCRIANCFSVTLTLAAVPGIRHLLSLTIEVWEVYANSQLLETSFPSCGTSPLVVDQSHNVLNSTRLGQVEVNPG